MLAGKPLDYPSHLQFNYLFVVASVCFLLLALFQNLEKSIIISKKKAAARTQLNSTQLNFAIREALSSLRKEEGKKQTRWLDTN